MPTRHCSINILRPRALDSSGWPANMTSVCESCQGCEAPTGDLGQEQGARVVGSWGRVMLQWACPKCGAVLAEETTALTAKDSARVIDADPLCHKCR